MSRRRRRRVRGSLLVGTVLAAGCGPEAASTPAPVPVARPVEQPAAKPPPPPLVLPPRAEDAPQPPEDPEGRWRWAVARVPELAGLRRVATAADFLQWVDARKRVVLHSPNLGGMRVRELPRYRLCDPLEFELRAGALVTRIPVDGSAARPDLPKKVDHVELTLTEHVDDTVAVRKPMPIIPGGCGSPAPQVSEAADGVLRYSGRPVRCDLSRRGAKKVTCDDGSRHRCWTTFGIEVIWLSPRDAREPPAAASPPGCPPCPPDPLGDAFEQLRTIVAEQKFLDLYEGGEEFYRDRAACEAAARARPPEPLARDFVHGFPLHPELKRICSQQVLTPIDGGGYLEVDWSLYASPLWPPQVARWYQGRLGTQLVPGKNDARWSAKLGDHTLDIAAPGDSGPSCDRDAPDSTHTLVRLSTAFRR